MVSYVELARNCIGRTGGELNYVNGQSGVSAPHRSVRVSDLVRYHQPRSCEELEHLISEHAYKVCDCGVRSKGTVEDFGDNLYEAQLSVLGFYKYSRAECRRWMYDLFVTHTMRGLFMELAAVECLTLVLPDCHVELASGELDEKYRVDILVSSGDFMCGVQVKPESYKRMRRSVKEFNLNANKGLGVPVFYLYYNLNCDFVNLFEVVGSISVYMDKCGVGSCHG